MDAMTPTFQIWVDGKDYGNLPTGQNVFTAHDLSFGPHKIVVAAKNTAGEVVDRKEINVTTVTTSSMTTHPQTDQVQPAAAAPVAAAPPPAPEPVRAQAPPPAPAPAAQASAPLASLPQTATSYPAAAVGGLGLLITGILLSRRRS
jgi:LPXTG-motif cell wall-anchored protein